MIKVVEKFNKMLTSFSADFDLAKEDNKDSSEFKLTLENTPRLQEDIELLAELEFYIRHKKLIIVENVENN